MHSIIDYSLFRIAYGFNLLTLWNLIYLLVNERISLLRQTWGYTGSPWEFSAIHWEKNEQYISKANKGYRSVNFEPSDLVWVHMKMERFIAHRRSKLQP
jgi:hypothetical protein